MPFQPSKLLTDTLNAFFIDSHSHEKSNQRFLPLPDLLEDQKPSNNDADEENKLLIHFVKKVASIRVLTEKVKARQESATTLLQLLYSIFSDVSTLKNNNAALWKYLLTPTAGRYVIYRILKICFIHKELDVELLQSLKEDLSETTTCTMEIDALEFLEVIYKKSLNATPSEEIDPLQTKNNYLKTYRLLTEKKEAVLKVKQLTDQATQPLKFAKTMPAFFSELILIYNTQDFKAEMTANPEQIPLLFPAIDLLAKANQLIKLTSSVEPSATLDYSLYENILFSRYLENFVHKHTLFDESLLHEKHTSLLYKTITHADALKKANCLTNPELRWLGAEAYKLIIHNRLDLSYEEKNKFYHAVIKTFSFIRPITLFYSEINAIVDSLFYNQNEIEAHHLLTCFIPHAHPSTKKEYAALAAAINFVSELNITSESMKSDVEAIKKYSIKQSKKMFRIILADLKNGKHDFNGLTLSFLKEKFNHLAADFKWKFIKTVESLQLKIDFLKFSAEEKESFQVFQAAVFRLSEILDFDKDELEKLKSDLVYDDHLYFDLFDESFPEEKKEDIQQPPVIPKKPTPYKQPKQKNDTLEKKEEPALKIHTPLSLQTMFKVNNMVPREKFPTALLDLSCLIHDLTGQYLNLTGGAVAYLCSNKENPNDFDCLICDTDLEILQRRLTLEGFTCTLVGKRMKVLKIAFIENGKRIDIDIVAGKTYGKQIHVAMKRILAFRDFGISSLFVPLSKDFLLKIYGYNHALRNFNKKKINIVGNNPQLFTEDPTRLMRLAKIQEYYPDFTMDNTLINLLKNTDFTQIFSKFINHKKSGQTNRRRVNTALDTLFTRFDFMTVVERITKLPIIEGLTGLTYESFLPTLDVLKPYADLQNANAQKLGFYQYIYIYLCFLERYEKEPLIHSSFYKITWALFIDPRDKMYFSYIEEKILGAQPKGFVNPPQELTDMINGIERHFKALEEAKLENANSQTKTPEPSVSIKLS